MTTRTKNIIWTKREVYAYLIVGSIMTGMAMGFWLAVLNQFHVEIIERIETNIPFMISFLRVFFMFLCAACTLFGPMIFGLGFKGMKELEKQ